MTDIEQIAIISGKGGVGKTSLSACFVSELKELVIADCDVDASNLNILIKAKRIETQTFKSGFEVEIDQNKCVKCGKCFESCGFQAIEKVGNNFKINEILCEGYGLCYELCPVKAIHKTPATCGEIYTSEIKNGFLIDANLKTGAENSGKLVSEVRNTALKIAKENNIDTIIIDGPPGIGCPAIASITGIDKALIITEASKSGYHDFLRALKLTQHFKVKTFVCVNKWDINPKISDQIEQDAVKNGATVLLKIPYDKDFKSSLIKGETIIGTNSKSAEIIKDIIKKIKEQ